VSGQLHVLAAIPLVPTGYDAGCSGEKENSLPLTIELNPGHPACSLVTILTVSYLKSFAKLYRSLIHIPLNQLSPQMWSVSCQLHAVPSHALWPHLSLAGCDLLLGDVEHFEGH